MESDFAPGMSMVPLAEEALLRDSEVTSNMLTPATEPSQPVKRMLRFLMAEDPENYRRAFYVFAAVALTLFLLVSTHLPFLEVVYGHDDIGFLDSAWKVHCGILPHADYSTALGALYPWIFNAGFALLGPTASVLPFCNAAVALVIGFGAWVIAARRLPAWLAGFFAFTQLLVAISPHLLRDNVFAATYASFYNRQGHALLSLVMLALFLPELGGQPERDDRRTGRAVGTILGVLLFLKVSYFLVGGELCVVAVVCARRRSWTLGKNLLVAFAVVFVACLPLIRFDLPAMWRDLHMASAARVAVPGAALTVQRFLDQFSSLWVEFALLAILQLSLCPPWFFRPKARTATTPAWAELLALTGAGMFIYLTNAPAECRAEMPLLATWLFVILANVLRHLTDAGAQRNLPVLCGVAGVLWIFTFGTGLMSLGWSTFPWQTRRQAVLMSNSPVFKSEALEDLRIFGKGGEGPSPDRMTYTDKVNDGIGMLRKVGGTHHVAALDFVNPFPFALQWPALRGGLWCWHLGFSFCDTACPIPEQALGDADMLMIPKYPGEPSGFPAMLRIYGAYIDQHFQLLDTSEHWYLLRRTS